MPTTSEIADGVHRFGANGVNFYMVVGDGGLTVVDAGFPGHWPLFTTWLHRNGWAVREITAVLLTHNHADHLGFADRAQAKGATVTIHRDDLDGVQHSGPPSVPERFARNAWRPGVLVRTAGWVRRGVTRTPTLADVRSCEDGERLDVPGNPRVIHVPGHTPGSAAYVFDEYDVICTGDALVTRDVVSGQPGIGISPEGLNADDEQALRSLARLEGLDVSVLAPGHGEPYHHGVASALQAARAIGATW